MKGSDHMERAASLAALMHERILVLDGGLGTMVQALGLDEGAYRGREFIGWKCSLRGCVDVLCLSAPRAVEGIHRAYLEAGADIVTTNSFSANAISLREYGLDGHAYRIAKAAAQIAREAADSFYTEEKPRFVAGSMGPTSKTASIAATVGDSSQRDVTFAELAEAYYDQARGLMDGGADAILLETVFDTLNAKAAIYSIRRLERETGLEIPLMISVTVSQKAGRTLSGQSLEAFWASIKHARPLSVGINCSFGAKDSLPHLERLASIADCLISVHPNAGLPNISGGYDETPESFAVAMRPFAERGLVNVMGGCCGTTPDFIRAIAPLAATFTPRRRQLPERTTVVSGLEALRIVPETNFINIGERCNVAGSAKFARLIREGNFEEALSVARAQVAAGAQVIDICMDDGMIDGPSAMQKFLNMIAGEVDIAKVPVMIDSSSFATIVAGLECCQGKAIVNSISLKEGPEEFLRRAAIVHRFGAAVVVMLFDEEGQATTLERKVAIAERAYKLLVSNGFPPEDIIFDPNILAVATGMAEHDGYALAYIEAVRWIKARLPHAKVSGGVSNLSFAFRGNNAVREAMHSAFLYHARQAGMDMGIVNPQMLKLYDDIEPKLLERVEDVILCRRPDASARLVEYAAQVRESSASQTAAVDDWRQAGVRERISYAMLHGIADFIEEDALEALRLEGSPMAVINSLMMPAMERVGVLFGDGKMFLPQVVKTAAVMKKGVAVLEPYISAGDSTSATAAKVVIATVKGDIHDIGKNIISVVMACNGCEIIDLGVMVEPAAIIEAVRKHNADFLCLSGLITPSLGEMINVCRELKQASITIPVIVGGATTSPMHTAVKIAPEYDGLVIHSSDASRNAQIINSLTSPTAKVFRAEVLSEQKRLRELYAAAQDRRPLVNYRERQLEAFDKRSKTGNTGSNTIGKELFVFHNYDIEKVIPRIDWDFFYAEWGVRENSDENQLRKDAEKMLQDFQKNNVLDLQGVLGCFLAQVCGDDVIIDGFRFPMLRNQTASDENLALTDFVSAQNPIKIFTISAGVGLKSYIDNLNAAGDRYGAFMAKVLADRLTEALAEEVVPAKEGERHAFGYPSCPDHSLKEVAFKLLDVEANCDMRLTSSYMIDPAESLCGMVIPGAKYFAVGRIGNDQLEDYAIRRGISVEIVKSLIPRNIQ